MALMLMWFIARRRVHLPVFFLLCCPGNDRISMVVNENEIVVTFYIFYFSLFRINLDSVFAHKNPSSKAALLYFTGSYNSRISYKILLLLLLLTNASLPFHASTYQTLCTLIPILRPPLFWKSTFSPRQMVLHNSVTPSFVFVWVSLCPSQGAAQMQFIIIFKNVQYYQWVSPYSYNSSTVTVASVWPRP